MIVKNSCSIIIILDKVKILARVVARKTGYNDYYKHTLLIEHNNIKLAREILEFCAMPSKLKCVVYTVADNKGVARCLTGIIGHCDPWVMSVSLADEDSTYKPDETDLSWLTEGI